jgi:hypothetical protein
MRRANAEWDFMGRTFLVLALGNLAERDPSERARCLSVIDAILEETLRLEREEGQSVFLLGYAARRPFVYQPSQSLFVEGEIALMLAVRRLVEERPDYRPLLVERAERIVRQLRAAPLLCGESYPDECWTFCNAVALAALRMHDVLDGTDHSGLFRDWVSTARRSLIHPTTGLLVSSFTLEGRVNDGPEGSTAFLVAHCLRLVDPEFARDQYRRARRELTRTALGFGWAREWPTSWEGPRDIDSGVVIPVLGASPSASGLALLGSLSFGDKDAARALLASLELGAVPIRDEQGLRYAASNQVGDAVLLYALVGGPLWSKVGAP